MVAINESSSPTRGLKKSGIFCATFDFVLSVLTIYTLIYGLQLINESIELADKPFSNDSPYYYDDREYSRQQRPLNEMIFRLLLWITAIHAVHLLFYLIFLVGVSKVSESNSDTNVTLSDRILLADESRSDLAVCHLVCADCARLDFFHVLLLANHGFGVLQVLLLLCDFVDT
jgi:hypothetical protein